MKKQPLIGQATDDQVAKWKQENELGIFAISVGGHIGYFRNPDIDDMNAATATLTKDNPLDYFTNLANDIHIGGSKALFDKTNPQLTLDFIETVKPKLEGKKGTLVNL